MRATRYRGAVLAVVACIIVATAAFASVVPLLDFQGFDWFWPAELGQPGSCYSAVGYVPQVDANYLNFDYGTNEYTFVIDYACMVYAETIGGIYGYYIYDGSTSSFRVYCDSLATGTTADYGINPPNGVSPSTFEDGDCVLHGTWVGDLEIFVDLGTLNGDISGMLEFTGGSQLGNIPPSQREQAFALAGITFDPPGPEGYHWQVDGFVCIQPPTSTQQSSWGKIKKQLGGEK
jgi:hypothetical protein